MIALLFFFFCRVQLYIERLAFKMSTLSKISFLGSVKQRRCISKANHWFFCFLLIWKTFLLLRKNERMILWRTRTMNCSWMLEARVNYCHQIGLAWEALAWTLLAPKELYTWYCPMTIQPLFEHTPVLNNNFEYWCRDDFVDCDFYED